MMLRMFQAEDAGDIMRLHSEAGKSFEDADITEEFIKSISLRPDFRFFIAEDGGRVVGFCGVLFHASLHRAEVGPIAVDGSVRKKKVGSLLLKKVYGFLREQGVRRLIAKVKADNAAALGFFLSAGFSEEGYFREYTGGGEDVVQLVRFI